MVVDVTFAEADDLPFDQVKVALLSAPNLKCEDVVIREAVSAGPMIGVSYPVPPVDADEYTERR